MNVTDKGANKAVLNFASGMTWWTPTSTPSHNKNIYYVNSSGVIAFTGTAMAGGARLANNKISNGLLQSQRTIMEILRDFMEIDRTD